jgi:RND family efflux transporter MFP subunit
VNGPERNESGEIIKPGQLLAKLVAPELDEEFQQKEAAVMQALAEIDQSAAAVKVAQALKLSAAAAVEEAEAGQQRAEAMLERWKSELSRMRELAEKKAVTQKLADETEQQFKGAEASNSEARAKTRSARAKLQETAVGIEKAEADLKAVKARWSVATADRDRVAVLRSYLEIRAPFSGVITVRNIDQGVLVLPTRGGNDVPLFILVQADIVRLFVDVPESDAALVEPGRPVTVKVPALVGRTFTGTVTRTGWALQLGTRTLSCEIDIPNAEGILRPGMYAHVELVVAQQEDALVLPKSAVHQTESQSMCLTVTDEGLVERKIVEVGIRTPTEVEIRSGLTGMEQVISANVAAFQAGQKVARQKP